MRSVGLILLLTVLSPAAYAQGEPPELADSSLASRLAALEQQVSRLAKLLDARLEGATAADAAEDDPFVVETRLRLDAVEEKLEQLGRSDAPDRFVPNTLDAMAISPSYRQEFFRATNGTLAVRNEMGSWMSVRLNGQRWRFPPGDSTIPVPYGTVQVQLVAGGARRTYQQSDWQFQNGQHLLSMTITDRVPQQE